jgi:hypothetical protein
VGALPSIAYYGIRTVGRKHPHLRIREPPKEMFLIPDRIWPGFGTASANEIVGALPNVPGALPRSGVDHVGLAPVGLGRDQHNWCDVVARERSQPPKMPTVVPRAGPRCSAASCAQSWATVLGRRAGTYLSAVSTPAMPQLSVGVS